MFKNIVTRVYVFILITLGVNQPLMAGTADFIFTVNTGLTSGADPTFTIPTYGTGYKYFVDCDNDGVFEANPTGIYVCDYTAMGHDKYTILIRESIGDGTGFPRVRFDEFGEANEVTELVNWGSGVWDSMEAAFEDASNMVVTATDVPKFAIGTSMRNMFRRAALANPDTSNWDTANVINMRSMFNRAFMADPDTSNWDTASVTDMRFMFISAEKADPDTSGWNTASVNNMTSMFNGATIANPNTSGWDTADVTDMSAMFYLTDVAKPDTSGWNTAKVTDMSFMFSNANAADPDTSGWDTSQVTNMSYMFYVAVLAQPDTSGWDTVNVTDMSNMFGFSPLVDPDTSNWITLNVNNMNGMFRDAVLANPDVSNWDISEVTSMINMFRGVTLSTESYDALLTQFSSQAVQAGVEFHGGNSKYCAQIPRNDLINNNGWVITDGGLSAQCGDIIFRNSFEIPVEKFNVNEKQFSFDFALLATVKLDSFPELIAIGVNDEQLKVITFHVRKSGQLYQIRISDLDQGAFDENIWIEHEWQDIGSLDLTTLTW